MCAYYFCFFFYNLCITQFVSFFFSSRRRHTSWARDWSSDVCSSDLVGVDVEGDLDLGNPTGRRRDADELEVAEQLVAVGHLPLALEDLDVDLGLAVVGGGEHLRAAGRDGGVALDELGHHAALGLDPERQRGDVEQQDVLDLALEHARLQGG